MIAGVQGLEAQQSCYVCGLGLLGTDAVGLEDAVALMGNLNAISLFPPLDRGGPVHCVTSKLAVEDSLPLHGKHQLKKTHGCRVCWPLGGLLLKHYLTKFVENMFAKSVKKTISLEQQYIRKPSSHQSS